MTILEAAPPAPAEADLERVRHVEPYPDYDKDNRYATVNNFGYTMSDGFAYHVVDACPKEPYLQSDTAVVMTTPWFVHPKYGYMEDLTTLLLKEGYRVIVVGAEGSAPSYDVGLLKKLQLLGQISLLNSGENLNAIAMHRLRDSESRPNVMIGTGSSRGHMVGMALNGLVYADFAAGAYPVKQPGDGFVDFTFRIVPGEVPNFARRIAGLGPKLVKYSRTGAIHPRELAHQIMTGPAIWSGQAGEISANAEPAVPSLLTFFSLDRPSKVDVQTSMLSHRIDTIIEIIEGRHMDIPAWYMIEGFMLRMATLREMRGFDGDFASPDVDYDRLRQVHHEILGDRLLEVIRLGEGGK